MEDNKYWIRPDGAILETPEGHIMFIQEHRQEYGLPDDVTSTDLLHQGWVRVSGTTIVLQHIDSPKVFENLRLLLMTMGYNQYGIWIDGYPYYVSLKDITERPFEEIFRDILSGKLELVTADAYDQGIFEVQPSWNETESDGSTSTKEKGVEFMPQDFQKEVWWERNLLDYLRKTFPGKKDVIPPEPDIGYPTQAWQVVKRLQKKGQPDRYFKIQLNIGHSVIKASSLAHARDKADETVSIIHADYPTLSETRVIQVIETNYIEYERFKENIEKSKKRRETSPETEKWLERWHKKSSLRKQADRPDLEIARAINKVLDLIEAEDFYTAYHVLFAELESHYNDIPNFQIEGWNYEGGERVFRPCINIGMYDLNLYNSGMLENNQDKVISALYDALNSMDMIREKQKDDKEVSKDTEKWLERWHKRSNLNRGVALT